MNLSLPKEVTDSMWLLVAGVIAWIARKLRPKIEGTELVQKKAAIEESLEDSATVLSRVKAELQAKFQEAEQELRQEHAVEMVRWQQRDDDLRETVRGMVEQSRVSSELHAASLAQMQLYVNRLLDENRALRDESTEQKRTEDVLKRQFNDYRDMFEKHESEVAEERQAWKEKTRSLQDRLRDMTNRGVEAGVKLTGSDLFPNGQNP